MHCPNGRKEQISQDDDGQALLPHSLSLLPHVLQIHGYVTAEITYSTTHVVTMYLLSHRALLFYKHI